MVIMSMEVYENTMQQVNLYRELELAKQEIEEGKVEDAMQSLDSRRKRYGL